MSVVINGTSGITTPGLDASGTNKFAATVGVGGATPAASGAGITFPATQSASSDANTLDDYEEGTWTPSLGGNTTYNSQYGRYVKIGNRVWIMGTVNVNAIGTGSTYRISGLPFTVAAHNSTWEVPVYIGYFANSATNVVYITGVFNSSTTNFDLNILTAAAASITTTPNIFKNSTRVDFAGYYDV